MTEFAVDGGNKKVTLTSDDEPIGWVPTYMVKVVKPQSMNIAIFMDYVKTEIEL